MAILCVIMIIEYTVDEFKTARKIDWLKLFSSISVHGWALIARAFLDMHFIVKKWIASNFTKKNTIIFGFHVRFESDLPSFLLPK